jgi:dihydrofolate reductase
MAKLILDISVSLDGYVAGPDPTHEEPLGIGGEQLHEWIVANPEWRAAHGLEGGEANADSAIVAEGLEGKAATIMGRRMFSGGAGPWQEDSNAGGWWGDEPPFRHPVFVLTHHARDPVAHANGTSYTFVTDGIESALEQARAAAGDREITLAGGGEVAGEFLAAELVDELRLHVVPILLGGGARLFDGATGRLERTRVVESPTGVTHLYLRPARG